ncbi:hypothetical protein ACSV4D_16265 [Flavobacterium sp. ARAG 55.4]|uniref:hypothetical protein n=1 Tax=Flavobacterium sp. ARAG 55.4 TaxID=3451357 RepID=UPI003F454163
MTLLIIFILTGILITGFIKIRIRANRHIKKYNFANEFRNRFISLANAYGATYDRWDRKGNVDQEQYIWLTKNVNTMQSDLGYIGTLHYVAAFQRYTINNYQILINTIPKFRNGQVEDFDINSSDDCLVRYIGFVEEVLDDDSKDLKNPVIWFKEGVHEIMSLPLFIFSWFGIISNKSVSKFMANAFYKFITGIIALVTLISGIVTIIQGKEATIEMINKLLNK